MSLKIPVGHVDVVEQRGGYYLRIWNGDGFDRLGKPSIQLNKEQLIRIRDGINKVVEES